MPDIKNSLVASDKISTGRISLSDFYGTKADGERLFGESEAYPRELDTFDETSGFGGKSVTIPNYLQGASNSTATTVNYFICCANECEDILNEVEASIGAPVAQPDQILIPLGNVENFEDEAPTHARRRPVCLENGQPETNVFIGVAMLNHNLLSPTGNFLSPRACVMDSLQ